MSRTNIRVIIVDDEAPARARLKRLLLNHPRIECVGEAADGISALSMMTERKPDAVFLDIQMPELDGLAVARAIPPGGPQVIFATAFDAHAIRAFELAAVDYLLKPVTNDRLAQAIERLEKKSLDKSADDPSELARAVLAKLGTKSRKMAVRSGAKYVVFDMGKIAAIVAEDHYATVIVEDRELLSDDSLDKLMRELDPERFLRVHRSAIINIEFVAELQHEGDRKYVAVLSNKTATRVPVSRERLDELKLKLGAT